MNVLGEAVHVSVLARREIRERWAVLGAAVVLGLLPVVPTAFWPDVRAGARVLAVAEFLVAQALAAFIGLELVGNDLASGRMGWYFSRPLSGFAIWAGKIGGAGALAVAATFLMSLPTLLLIEPVPGSDGRLEIMPLGAVGFVVFPLMFVGAGAAGGIIARGRSRWLILDGVASITQAPLMVWASERIHQWARGAHHGRDDFGDGVVIVLAVAFLAASAAGVIVGRADPRRAHAATSLTLWGILVPAQIALLVYVRWLTG